MPPPATSATAMSTKMPDDEPPESDSVSAARSVPASLESVVDATVSLETMVLSDASVAIASSGAVVDCDADSPLPPAATVVDVALIALPETV